MDTGDFVIVINADKVALSGNKRETKLAYRHSGYPGGLSATAYGDLLDKDSRKAIEKAVWGMLPKNRLGRQMLKKLKVYGGPDHPHAAQKPTSFDIVQIAQYPNRRTPESTTTDRQVRSEEHPWLRPPPKPSRPSKPAR